MTTDLASSQVQVLQGADNATIQLRLVQSLMHVSQPLSLPGLLTCTDPFISLISLQPRILLIENFLPAADCQVLICHP